MVSCSVLRKSRPDDVTQPAISGSEVPDIQTEKFKGCSCHPEEAASGYFKMTKLLNMSVSDIMANPFFLAMMFFVFCETLYPIILLMYGKAHSVSDCDSEKWR